MKNENGNFRINYNHFRQSSQVIFIKSSIGIHRFWALHFIGMLVNLIRRNYDNSIEFLVRRFNTITHFSVIFLISAHRMHRRYRRRFGKFGKFTRIPSRWQLHLNWKLFICESSIKWENWKFIIWNNCRADFHCRDWPSVATKVEMRSDERAKNLIKILFESNWMLCLEKMSSTGRLLALLVGWCVRHKDSNGSTPPTGVCSKHDLWLGKCLPLVSFDEREFPWECSMVLC